MSAGKRTPGRRVYPDALGQLKLAEGDYGRDTYRDGKWYARPPGCSMGCLSDTHTVTVHEDGTVSASPSIDVHESNGRRWHGYLERGIWREV